MHNHAPYSFGHKVQVGGRVFPLKQPKRSTNVYPSNMMDLDFSLLEMGKTYYISSVIRQSFFLPKQP